MMERRGFDGESGSVIRRGNGVDDGEKGSVMGRGGCDGEGGSVLGRRGH